MKIKFLFYIMFLIVAGCSFLAKSSIVYKNKLVLFLACTSIASLIAVDYVNAITNKLGSNAKYFEPVFSFFNTNFEPSDIISLAALAFTLITYRVNSNKDKLHRDDDRVVNTFFKLLDMIIEKSKSITEKDIIDFVNTIKESLDDKPYHKSVDVHKAFKLMEIFHLNKVEINGMLNQSGVDDTLREKVKQLTASDNKEDYWMFLSNPQISNALSASISLKRKATFNQKEFETLGNIGVMELLKHHYKENELLNRPIRFEHAFQIIDNKMFAKNMDNNGDFFRLFHRAIKLINDSNIKDKDKYYGILRAMLPDYLVIYIYYNCVFTSRGLGLGVQLIGTSFFGDENDFTFNEKGDLPKFTQHIPIKYLVFKRQDPKIMIELFSQKKRDDGYSKTKLKKDASIVFSKTDVQFRKSFDKIQIAIADISENDIL